VTVKERLSVGATLPAEVELRTVPSPWGRGWQNIGMCIRATMCTWSNRQTVG
jgi:hypothetical protein